MKTLYESILCDPDELTASADRLIEIESKLIVRFSWLKTVPQNQAVYTESAIWNVIKHGFQERRREQFTNDQWEIFALFIKVALKYFKWECQESDDLEYWDNLSYERRTPHLSKEFERIFPRIFEGRPDDPRMAPYSRHSYFHYIKPSHFYSLDDPDLTRTELCRRNVRDFVNGLRSLGCPCTYPNR